MSTYKQTTVANAIEYRGYKIETTGSGEFEVWEWDEEYGYVQWSQSFDTQKQAEKCIDIEIMFLAWDK